MKPICLYKCNLDQLSSPFLLPSGWSLKPKSSLTQPAAENPPWVTTAVENWRSLKSRIIIYRSSRRRWDDSVVHVNHRPVKTLLASPLPFLMASARPSRPPPPAAAPYEHL